MQGLTLFTLKINPNELFEEVKFDSRLELFEFKERAMLRKQFGSKNATSAKIFSSEFRREVPPGVYGQAPPPMPACFQGLICGEGGMRP
jgi:hypothetical protein